MSKDFQLSITEKNSAMKIYSDMKVQAMNDWFKRTGRVSGFFADKDSVEYKQYKQASAEIDKLCRGKNV